MGLGGVLKRERIVSRLEVHGAHARLLSALAVLAHRLVRRQLTVSAHNGVIVT